MSLIGRIKSIITVLIGYRNPKAIEFVKQSRELGDNTATERPIDFLFIGGTDSLKKLLPELESRGFAQIKSNYSEPDKSIMVSKVMNVDSFISKQIIDQLDRLADKYHVIFDGWETTPVIKNKVHGAN